MNRATERLTRPEGIPLVSGLVLVGGFVLPVAGWLAGVLLLARSKAWTRRGKFFGAAVWPLLLLPGATMLYLSRQYSQWCYGPYGGPESSMQCGDEVFRVEWPLVWTGAALLLAGVGAASGFLRSRRSSDR